MDSWIIFSAVMCRKSISFLICNSEYEQFIQSNLLVNTISPWTNSYRYAKNT